METLNNYFKYINLKAFCINYGLNYEFTRQVLQGKRPLTEKFAKSITAHVVHYHQMQQEIFKQL